MRLLALAREFRRLGHQVEVVTALPNYPTGRILPAYRGRVRLSETQDGFPVHRTWLWAAKGAGVGRALNFLSFMGTALLPLRRVADPDVIFVKSPPITLFLTALAYRRRFPRALLVFNIADQWIEAMRHSGVITNRRVLAGLGRYARFCYARADLITAATCGLVDDLVLRQGIPAGKVLLLPNGADAPAAVDNAASDDAVIERLLDAQGMQRRHLAVCIGTHGYIHGMETLLDAAEYRITDLPDLVVLLVGDGFGKGQAGRTRPGARSRQRALRRPDPSGCGPAALPARLRRAQHVARPADRRRGPPGTRRERDGGRSSSGLCGRRRGRRPGAPRGRRHRDASGRRPGGRRRHARAPGRPRQSARDRQASPNLTSSATSPGPPSSAAFRTRSLTSWRRAMPLGTGAAARCPKGGRSGWQAPSK